MAAAAAVVAAFEYCYNGYFIQIVMSIMIYNLISL